MPTVVGHWYDPPAMTKRGLIARICEQLASQLAAISESAQAAHANATSEESKAENQYDTRALEASYLAGAQANRAAEVRASLGRYKALTTTDFSDGQAIALTALVKLESNRGSAWYFIGPSSGGLEVSHEGETVLVITPSAPLGQKLLGQEEGDEFSMGSREYEIVEVL